MFAKPSAQGVPLSHTSWHQPSIHRSWPLSRVLHYKNCCNHVVGFRSAVLTLFEKLRSSCPTHPSLADLAESIATGSSCVGKGKQARLLESQKCSRIVIPYHPCLRRLDNLLSAVHDDFRAHDWHDLVPKVSWCLGSPNMARLMNSDSVKKLQMHAGDPGGDCL